MDLDTIREALRRAGEAGASNDLLEALRVMEQEACEEYASAEYDAEECPQDEGVKISIFHIEISFSADTAIRALDSLISCDQCGAEEECGGNSPE